MAMLNAMHYDWQLSRSHRIYLEKLVFLLIFDRILSGWILAMRTIKCLKGIW